MAKSKFIAGVYIAPGDSLYYRTSPSGSWSQVDMNEGSEGLILYPVGVGVRDLIVHLNTRLDAEGAPFELSLNIDPASSSWGKITVNRLSGSGYLEISANAGQQAPSATDYPNDLFGVLFPDAWRRNKRYFSDTSWPHTHTAPVGGCLHLSRLAKHIRIANTYKVAQAISDTGKVFGFCAGMSRTFNVSVRLVGSLPRELLFGETAQLRSFLLSAGRGLPVAIFADAEEADPYTRYNPSGVLMGVLVDGGEWMAEAPEANYYGNWEKSFTFERIAQGLWA